MSGLRPEGWAKASSFKSVTHSQGAIIYPIPLYDTEVTFLGLLAPPSMLTTAAERSLEMIKGTSMHCPHQKGLSIFLGIYLSAVRLMATRFKQWSDRDPNPHSFLLTTTKNNRNLLSQPWVIEVGQLLDVVCSCAVYNGYHPHTAEIRRSHMNEREVSM